MNFNFVVREYLLYVVLSPLLVCIYVKVGKGVKTRRINSQDIATLAETASDMSFLNTQAENIKWIMNCIEQQTFIEWNHISESYQHFLEFFSHSNDINIQNKWNYYMYKRFNHVPHTYNGICISSFFDICLVGVRKLAMIEYFEKNCEPSVCMKEAMFHILCRILHGYSIFPQMIRITKSGKLSSHRLCLTSKSINTF